MAGIQSIDFSQKLTSSPRGEGRSPAQNRSPVELSRLLGWGLAGAILVFTGGILAGLKIADLRNMDRNLVKYPDRDRSRNFANVGNSDQADRTRTENRTEERSTKPQTAAETEESSTISGRPAKPAGAAETASLIIRIGAFRPSRAGELVRSLNNLAELERIPFHQCNGREDLNPGRTHVFAVPTEDGKVHRLFAGCYRSPEEAKKALTVLQNTGVASLKDAKAYKLTD